MVIYIKAIERYFNVELFIFLCKVVLTVERHRVDEIEMGDHSHKSSFVQCCLFKFYRANFVQIFEPEVETVLTM